MAGRNGLIGSVTWVAVALGLAVAGWAALKDVSANEAPDPAAGERPVAAAAANDGALDGDALYDKARAASVEVLVGGRQEGSGWFASEDGWVVTAGHVVRGKREPVEVISTTIGRLPARVVATDRGHDLALLKVSPGAAGPRAFPFLEVAERVPPPGEEVFLFAAAFFRHEVMIKGSTARREATFEFFPDQGNYVRVFHVTAPSPPGTSGGCWLDRHGRVVGNQCGFISRDGIGVGIAETAPPDAIARLVRQRTSVAVTTMGCAFEEVWSQPAGVIARYPAGAGGLLPVFLREGGPARSAGLTDTNLITSVDGKPVQWRDDLLQVIHGRRPGERVRLTVLEPGGAAPREVEVTLGELQ